MKLSSFVVCNVDMGSVAMGIANTSVNARSNIYGICGAMVVVLVGKK